MRPLAKRTAIAIVVLLAFTAGTLAVHTLLLHLSHKRSKLKHKSGKSDLYVEQAKTTRLRRGLRSLPRLGN